MCYTRTFDVILQVGLTELKAQIGWFDSVTVSTRGILSCSSPSDFCDVWVQGEEKRFEIPYSESLFLKLNSLFRTDAVVIYDNPSERITNDGAEW